MTHTHAAAGRSRPHRLLLVAAPMAILILGVAVAAVLMSTSPMAGKSAPAATATLVQVLPAAVSDRAMTFEVMGSVVPAREVDLMPRVSGQVRVLSDEFVPGGLLRQGDTVLALDDADYRLALRQARSAVDTAQADLDMEHGRQRVAQAQLEMFKEAAEALGGDTSLALREPQMAQARAALDTALADLEQAELDLARTTVRAPFNALVTERSVDVGSQVGSSDSLATLVGTDEYWIEAAVPVDKLRWMRFPSGDQSGGEVAVVARSQDAPVTGHVLRREGGLMESSRMAQVLISVSDPLGLERGGNPLLLDEYVTVRVTGRVVQGVVALPRACLREGKDVWVFDGGELRIRAVTVAWSDADTVYLSQGLEAGERVVTTDIATAVEGMKLRLKGADATSAQPESPHAG